MSATIMATEYTVHFQKGHRVGTRSLRTMLYGIILVGGLQYIDPTPDGGYTITDPFDPKALTYVEPDGDGGYTATQPFNPHGLKYIEPDGGGSYTVISPFEDTQ